jgi:hypothetical protein
MAFPVVVRLSWQGREIRSEKDRPEGVSIRAWRDIAKASFSAMAFFWHDNFLQLHFGSNARVRYGGEVIKQRSSKWLARKLKISNTEVRASANVQNDDTPQVRQQKMQVARQRLVSAAGGANYNVHTGTLRQMVKTAIVRAFPGRFRIEMPVPGYIPSRRKNPKDPDIRAELTVVLPSEIEALQKVGQRVLTQTMQQVLSTGRVPAGARS